MSKKHFINILILLIINKYTYSQFITPEPLIKKNNLTIYEFFNDTDSNSLKKTLNKMDSLYQNGKYKQVLSMANNMIHNDSSFFPAYRIRAIINYDITDYTECINDCNYILELTDSPDLFALRGLSYYQKGAYQNAKNDFDKAISVNSKYYYLYSLWSTYLAVNENCEEAAKYSKKALSKSNDISTYYYTAKYYLLCEKADTALYYINKTLDSVRFIDAYILKAYIKYALEDFDGYEQDMDTVVSEIDKEIKKMPNNMALYKLKYRVLISYDEFYKALAVIDSMLFYQPSVDIYMEKYYLYCKIGMYEEADSCLNKALEMDSANIQLITFLIESFTKQRKYEKVILYCNKIIDQNDTKYDPKNVSYAYRKRGNAKYLSGKKSEGCNDIEKAASLGDEEAIIIVKQTCSLIKK